MREDLKEKLKDKTLDELLDLLILGLEYEKLKSNKVVSQWGKISRYQSLGSGVLIFKRKEQNDKKFDTIINSDNVLWM